MAAKLFISSSTKDADLFLIVRVFDPQGKELTFMGSTDPNTPIANGWLRASHRRLDPARTLPYRPYHPHDRVEPLTPGEIYECDIEIVPSCIVVPAGWRVALTCSRQGLRIRRRTGRVRQEVPLRHAGHGRHDAQRSRQPAGGRLRRQGKAVCRRPVGIVSAAADYSVLNLGERGVDIHVRGHEVKADSHERTCRKALRSRSLIPIRLAYRQT